ncbi:hypothetical protein ABT369_52090 [Dactylosporangium sp. NPDC000244]|uniref:hypothetical protein n=1 Tax=Dactylosporangium sp. NPDC000244 TaxID=3154365 RepID=UPI00332A4463
MPDPAPQASLGPAALGTAANDRTGSSTTPAALSDGYALGLTPGAVIVAALVLRRRTCPHTPEHGHHTSDRPGSTTAETIRHERSPTAEACALRQRPLTD